jgi:hypothetical protein
MSLLLGRRHRGILAASAAPFTYEVTMAKPNQNPPSFNVADDPAVGAARAKLTELQVKLGGAEQQLRQSDNDDSPKRTAFDAAVDRLLGREPATVAIRPDEARQRVRVLEGAIAKQRQATVDGERVASELIAREALPTYSAIVKRMARAITELRQTVIEERSFREAMIAGDCRLGGVIHPVALAGSLRPGQTDLFDAWLTEAAQHFELN